MRILGLSILLFLISCNAGHKKPIQQNQVKDEAPTFENDHAEVFSKQGISLFIFSEPVKDYETVGYIEDDFIQEAVQSTEGDGFLEKAINKVENISKRVDFQKLTTLMVKKANQQYDDFDAIVFKSGLNKGTVIKFKK